MQIRFEYLAFILISFQSSLASFAHKHIIHAQKRARGVALHRNGFWILNHYRYSNIIGIWPRSVDRDGVAAVEFSNHHSDAQRT
jgi:hypothetical protein